MVRGNPWSVIIIFITSGQPTGWWIWLSTVMVAVQYSDGCVIRIR